jgi:hypothetical protein
LVNPKNFAAKINREKVYWKCFFGFVLMRLNLCELGEIRMLHRVCGAEVGSSKSEVGIQLAVCSWHSFHELAQIVFLVISSCRPERWSLSEVEMSRGGSREIFTGAKSQESRFRREKIIENRLSLMGS